MFGISLAEAVALRWESYCQKSKAKIKTGVSGLTANPAPKNQVLLPQNPLLNTKILYQHRLKLNQGQLFG
jgi:hypothetical protein